MEHEWWARAVQAAVWIVLMTLIMGWVARSRLRRSPVASGQTLLLHMPPSILILGLVGFAFFAGIAIISNTIGKNETSTVWTTACFVGFACLNLWLVFGYFTSSHEVSAEGLQYRTWLGQKAFLRWEEVVHVSYAPGMKWFKLRTDTKRTALVTAMLTGLPELAQTLLTRVPEERIDPASREVLEQTAQGTPPSSWG